MKLTFQRAAGVTDAPLSLVGLEGDHANIPSVLIQEYIIICGDIGTHTKTRDEALEKIRKEMADNGHEIVVLDGFYET